MGKDKKRIQKNKARKAQRKKTKKKTRHTPVGQGGRNIWAPYDKQTIRTAPLREVWVSSAMLETGMGYAIISRNLPDNQVASGTFLLDTYCLGVKDAFCSLQSVSEYENMVEKTSAKQELIHVEPAYAKKLIEGVVAYAADLGFKAGSDYHNARILLDEFDESECLEEFEYGLNGQPYYVAGPHESEAKSNRIISTLRSKKGDGGFHFTMPMASGEDLAEFFTEDDSEVEEIWDDE